VHTDRVQHGGVAFPLHALWSHTFALHALWSHVVTHVRRHTAYRVHYEEGKLTDFEIQGGIPETLPRLLTTILEIVRATPK